MSVGKAICLLNKGFHNEADLLTHDSITRIISTRDLYSQFKRLPQNVIQFIYGFIFCFFGGTFPTLFAALQAAEHGGRQNIANALSELSDEILIIIEESKKDDAADVDKDGKRDVDQISARELLTRKTKLVLKKMNPDKVDKAISSIYRVWLSVAAVLSIQFARTISMALAIADFLEKPSDRFIAPTIGLVIPKEYGKWVPVAISWITKAIAISIAWYIQSVVSATVSSLQGGLMMARAVYFFCLHHQFTMFGMITKNHEDSIVDEVLSYLFAGMGFYVQLVHGFKPPFPVNIILWPFELAEYYIRWTITSKR